MPAKLNVKHCGLPIECPAECEFMRTVADQLDGVEVTFCNEPADGQCPYPTGAQWVQSEEQPILIMDRQNNDDIPL